MLYNYGITPLKNDNFDKRCEDIAWQVKNNVISMPLFIMTLVPEGVPVWDKAERYAVLYRKYKELLEPQGVRCGILIQASLGHGYPIVSNPFQKLINLNDGKEQFVCCPEDEAFLEHFSSVLKRIASEHPAVIMLDDDFRLMLRPGKGCACPLHMKKFNDETGLNLTREELWAHLERDENDEISKAFVKVQNNSLIKAAERFRAAIDSVDPTIQGINCTSGYVCEAVSKTNPIFAGKGNPTIVRLPNGIYAPYSTREFSALMLYTAICKTKLKREGIDIILAETDTIPFNRYAKSAGYLHSQFTAAIMDGCSGAKHWLTRTSAFELDSGVAYRKILSEHSAFYDILASIADKIKWVGINQFFVEAKKPLFKAAYSKCSFVTKNIERMGLPFYFSDTVEGAVFLEDRVVKEMTDAEIENVFSCSVFITANAAIDIVKRGYAHLIGVEISEYVGKTVTLESFTGELDACCTKQNGLKLINIVNDNVKVISHNVRPNNEKAEILSPAVTLYKRDNGKISVVFCGEPDADFNYQRGFAFLNESRKAQLIDLLKDADALPIYCVGDAEMCFRAGYVGEDMIAAIYPLGTDPADDIMLYINKKPRKISMLEKDGTKRTLKFSEAEENIYKINVKVRAMQPIILFIK